MTFFSQLFLDGSYRFPGVLAKSYVDHLTSLDLLEDAKKNTPDGGHTGGETIEQTHIHFAHRFGNSVSRFLFLLHNFDGRFSDVEQRISEIFLDGSISLLDIPSGTGAAGLTILTAICEARASGQLPQLPLTVTFHVGDISTDALDIYEEMLNQVASFCASVGVTIKIHKHLWNALSLPTTAKMLREFVSDANISNEIIMLISNFSDFSKDHKEEILEQVNLALGIVADLSSTFIWIEPQSKSNRWIHKKINQMLDKLLYMIFSYNSEDGTGGHYCWLCPVKKINVDSDMKLIAFRRSTI